MKHSLGKLLKNDQDTIFLCPLKGFSFPSQGKLKVLKLNHFSLSLILPPKINFEFFGDLIGQEFKGVIGPIEAEALNDWPILVLSAKEISKGDSPETKILKLNNYLSNFLNHLWIERDHAVNFTVSYLITRTGNNSMFTSRFIDRFWYTDRDGKDDVTTLFSHKEITSAVDRLNHAENLSDLIPHFEQTSRIEGTSRKDLFALWLDDARQTHDVLVKISKYITALSKELGLRRDTACPTLPSCQNAIHSNTSKPAGKSYAWQS